MDKFYAVLIYTDNGSVPVIYGIGKTEEDAKKDVDAYLPKST